MFLQLLLFNIHCSHFWLSSFVPVALHCLLELFPQFNAALLPPTHLLLAALRKQIVFLCIIASTGQIQIPCLYSCFLNPLELKKKKPFLQSICLLSFPSAHLPFGLGPLALSQENVLQYFSFIYLVLVLLGINH